MAIAQQYARNYNVILSNGSTVTVTGEVIGVLVIGELPEPLSLELAPVPLDGSELLLPPLDPLDPSDPLLPLLAPVSDDVPLPVVSLPVAGVLVASPPTPGALVALFAALCDDEPFNSNGAGTCTLPDWAFDPLDVALEAAEPFCGDVFAGVDPPLVWLDWLDDPLEDDARSYSANGCTLLKIAIESM